MDEINFDGLVGPTHFYGGFAYGDLAAMQNRHHRSNPRLAALQGLKKMKLLHDLGLHQGIIPPHPRPLMRELRTLGFSGTDTQVIETASKTSPNLYYALCSASNMWVANSAICSPSADTKDGKVHFTIANLSTHFHRNCESTDTYHLFKQLFPFATIHPPLLGSLSDEGAANHTRFADGTHLFVYGRSLFEQCWTQFPARQTKEAFEAIARQHGLKKALFIKQANQCIDQGGFHNDVVATGHGPYYFYHEEAYETTLPPLPVQAIPISKKTLSLKQAIETYIFNSQIVTLPSKELALIAPLACESLSLNWLPIQKRHFVDLSQSLANGGGPACLRLRVVLTPDERAKVHPYIFLTDTLYQKLTRWIETHYRDRLEMKDLADPQFYQECLTCYEGLYRLLHLRTPI